MENHDASKTAQTIATVHEGNALVLLKQAAILMHQNALEDQRTEVATFMEVQAKKLDAIWNECFYFKIPDPARTDRMPGRVKS